MKIVIVGGVAGGATAAARLRRLGEKDEIVLFERDDYISFANCGLPYYLGGVIPRREDLFVADKEGMAKRFRLDIRTQTEVTQIDRNARDVSVKNHLTGEIYRESYDILLLSPGARPLRPAIPGIQEAQNVYTLRNVEDTDQIFRHLQNEHPQNAVVIGGGFIGLEMAENLKRRGLDVALVEKLPQVLKPLDFEMAQLLHQEIENAGVQLHLQQAVTAFEDAGQTVVLEDGTRLSSDLTLLALGVRPESSLAGESGLALSPSGHIRVTPDFHAIDAKTGETEPNILAVGDAIAVSNCLGVETAIPLAGPANRQARLAADGLHGLSLAPYQVQGTSVLKVFRLTAASTGLNETQLREANLPYTALHTHRSNHAGYYPGATGMVLKLLFHPETGQIYGAQAVGQEGTEKRIDVIATAMKLDCPAWKLAELELSYAPPYSSAKDPVNILGYMAESVKRGVYTPVQWYEIDDIVKNGGVLLDVRTARERERGQIPGSIHRELDILRQQLDQLPQDKSAPIYLHCQAGLRSYYALCILAGYGYTNLHNLSGGYATYQAAHYGTPPAFDCTGKPLGKV